MVNSKFLKVKKWVDANEAAERLSLSLEDKVTALDLLELALEKEIILSVKFPRNTKFIVREVTEESMPYIEYLESLFEFHLAAEFENRKDFPVNGSEEYNSRFERLLVDTCLKNNLSLSKTNELYTENKYPSIYEVTYDYYEFSNELELMEDIVFELPMIGAEVLDIEGLIETNKKRKPAETINLDGVFIRATNGKLYNLMNKFNEEEFPSVYESESDNFNIGYINPSHYFPAAGLPVGCEIGISPNNLFSFERRLSDAEESDDELSKKAITVLGAVLHEVTGKAVKWTQGQLAASIESKNIKGLKERTINGIFSLANKSYKS